MPEGSQLCQEAKTRLETDQWTTSGKEVEQHWPMPNKHTPTQTPTPYNEQKHQVETTTQLLQSEVNQTQC